MNDTTKFPLEHFHEIEFGPYKYRHYGGDHWQRNCTERYGHGGEWTHVNVILVPRTCILRCKEVYGAEFVEPTTKTS